MGIISKINEVEDLVASLLSRCDDVWIRRDEFNSYDLLDVIAGEFKTDLDKIRRLL